VGRDYTCKVLEAIDEGILDYKAVAEAALRFMSEDDVKEMCHANELLIEVDEDEDEDE
jgi:hypothetical protein